VVVKEQDEGGEPKKTRAKLLSTIYKLRQDVEHTYLCLLAVVIKQYLLSENWVNTHTKYY
jgi:hypothetical protein